MSGTPRILLWGGRSQGRLLDAMIRDRFGCGPALIHDHTLEAPQFATEAEFSSNPSHLRALVDTLGLTHAVVAIGNAHGLARIKTSEALETDLGLAPMDLRHTQAWIESDAQIGAGMQVMPHATVHRFCRIGPQVILNTGCTVDHECEIGRGVHVMGAAALTGRVRVGDFASIGTNATILPDVSVGAGAIVGAGAVVTRDVPENTVVTGVPARAIRVSPPRFDAATVNFG